jgi:DNA-binding IclR family transcriptional regulator
MMSSTRRVVKQAAAATTPFSVPAVAKAVAIVRLLNDRGSDGATLSEVADALAMTRSHCHNILRTLAVHDWISYDPEARLYRLSSGISADSATALVSMAHFDTLRAFTLELSNTVGLQCTLSEPIADGTFLVVLTTKQSDASMLSVPVGYKFPPGTPVQTKAMLAWIDAAAQEVALEAWHPVRFTNMTITDRPRLREALRQTRRDGFARSDGEFVEGFTTLALPIFNRSGDVFAVLSLAGPEDDFRAREAKAAQELIATVARIHAKIDGRPPVDFPRPK